MSPEDPVSTSIWVGRFALSRWLVIAAAITGTEFISHIVLHDKDRPHTSLLGTDYGAQICIIDVSSVYYHGFHSPVKIFH